MSPVKASTMSEAEARQLTDEINAAFREMAARPHPKRTKAPSTLVYFIAAGLFGPIKIGIARDIQSRMAGLQTGCPDELVLLATMPGGRETERQLHERFAPTHMRGEWFHRSPALLSFIEEVAA